MNLTWIFVILMVIASSIDGRETVDKSRETVLPSAKNNFTTEKKSETEVCYGVLGCFGLTDFFDPLKRPINLLPNSPEDINVTFQLYTEDNRYNSILLRYDSPKSDFDSTTFDPKKPTKFIIHGYTGSFDEFDWMGSIKDLIIKKYPRTFNVFGVDWSKGAGKFIYNQAAANTRVVGAAIAHFISQLVKYTNASPKDIHLIGHSLGAHSAGYAGKRIDNPKINRITGLDPAGPNFYSDDSKGRLDYQDAYYVDVVHTDYGNLVLQGLGLEDAVGRTDFYPNGGSKQPGCGKSKGIYNILSEGLVDGLSETVTCNHARSTRFFTSDTSGAENNCQYIGYKCKSYEEFEGGKCGECDRNNSQCAILNIWGQYDKKTGRLYEKQMSKNEVNEKYYYKTSDKKPFCLQHYQIQISFSADSEESTGKITLDLQGTKRSVKDVEFSKDWGSFTAGKTYYVLITYEKSLGKVIKANLKYKFGGIQTLNPLSLINAPKIKVERLKINYMSNIDPELRAANSSELCSTNNEQLSSGKSVVFLECANLSRDSNSNPTSKTTTTTAKSLIGNIFG